MNMKYIQRLFILMLLVAAAGSVFAQHGGGPGNGDPGDTTHHRDSIHGILHHPPCNVFVDSCFQILLSKLSADDASALQTALTNKDALMTQLNQLRADIRAALKSGDTATAHALMAQVRPLMQQLHDADKAIRDILRRNQTAVRETMKDCCPMPPRDTSHHHRGPHGGSDPIGNLELKMSPIRPNPVTKGTTNATFEYDLTVAATDVMVTVSDQLGNIVKSFDLGKEDAGHYSYSLDVTGMAQGGYLVRLQADKAVATQMLMVLP
jgi:hypothetical protein